MTSPSPLPDRTYERLLALPQGLAAHAGFGAAVAALESGDATAFEGVHGSACALLAANLGTRVPGILVVICADADEMDEFCADMKLFSRRPVDCFPPWESDLDENVPHDEIHGSRLSDLERSTGGGFIRRLSKSTRLLHSEFATTGSRPDRSGRQHPTPLGGCDVGCRESVSVVGGAGVSPHQRG